MSESSNLGQGALDRLATAALQSQFDDADDLSVEVETSPSALSKGEVKSMTIDGEGVSLTDQIETAEMHIQANAIKVNPFKAMFGNIVLEDNINAIADLSFSADDIATAMNTDDFQSRLPFDKDVHGDEYASIDHVHVSFEADSVAINAALVKSNEIESVCFKLIPCVSDQQQIRFVSDHETKLEAIATATAKQLEALLDTDQFEIPGASLCLVGAVIDGDRLVMQMKVEVSQLSVS